MTYRLPFLLIFLGLSGCTFHSSQIQTVRSMLNPPEALPEHYWLLQLDENKIPLVAVVENPPFTSYVNAQGISINHNGRDITFVGGWPEMGAEIRIGRDGNVLTHTMSDGSVLEVSCSEWTLVTPLVWQLDCQSNSGLSWNYRNEVHIDDSGRITYMHYALWPGLSPVDLTWFPVSGEGTEILAEAQQ